MGSREWYVDVVTPPSLVVETREPLATAVNPSGAVIRKVKSALSLG